MTRAKFVGRALGTVVAGALAVACYARVETGPREECRTVEVRNRHDVEVCTTRCTDDGCREHCRERERWSRAHRCWVE
jgi:hypothetical protein